METTYDFLDLLGLDESAVERDIRRAYARRLKQIDQEADPSGFQQLRDAYETALNWAAWKARQDQAAQDGQEPPPTESTAAAAEPEAPGAPAPQPADEHPGFVPEDPRALAHAVFHRLVANMPALVALPPREDAAQWVDELTQRLQDEELVNIDARIYFEAYVASILAEGWRPGHESLFVAAGRVFGWSADPRRLQQFAQTGALLNQALVERELFAVQPPEDRLAMRRVLQLLRTAQPPGARAVRADMRHLERMMARFPSLMRVVASSDNVEHWRAAYAEMGGPPIGTAFEVADAAPAPAPKRSRWLGVVIFLVLSFVLRTMFNEFGGEQKYGPGFMPPENGADTQQEDEAGPRLKPAVGTHWEGLLVLGKSPAVGREVLETHIPPVHFTVPDDGKARTLDTKVRVFLDGQGRVERTQNLLTSGEPSFDDAVRRALRSAKPFPPATPSVFDLSFVGRVHQGPIPESWAAPAEEAAKPTTLRKLRAEVKLSDYVPAIVFKPSRFTKEGELKVTHKVLLDKQGKVTGVELVRSSGELRYDRAVEDALRASKPFPEGVPRSFETWHSINVYRKPQEQRPAGQADSEPAPQQKDAPPAEDSAG